MSEADREAYLARVRARLVASRRGGPFVESAVVAASPAPLAPPVVRAQPSPYSETAKPVGDHHVELAGLAAALAGVAERLAEIAMVVRR